MTTTYETTIATVTDDESGEMYRTVRLWDVYRQVWDTYRVDEVPPRLMATLTEDERQRIHAAR